MAEVELAEAFEAAAALRSREAAETEAGAAGGWGCCWFLLEATIPSEAVDSLWMKKRKRDFGLSSLFKPSSLFKGLLVLDRIEL